MRFRFVAAVVPVLLLSHAAVAQAPAGWQTFHDPRGFSVSFPPDWTADPAYFEKDYPTGDGEPPHLPALALRPTLPLQPGTTLSDGDVRLTVLPLPPGRTDCVAWEFIAEPPPDYSSSLDSSNPDKASMTGGDPGGWYTYEDTVWRISTTPCVGVHYYIGYYADGSDQAKSLKPFDRAKMLTLLDAIRATVVVDPPR